MSKFYIGASTWPGISKLIEECGEVLQVCGKLIATGGDHAHWDGTNLKDRLESELGDLMAAIGFVSTHCNLDVAKMQNQMEVKAKRFESWHETPIEPDRPVPHVSIQCDDKRHDRCPATIYYHHKPGVVRDYPCLCHCHR
jgi:NTP pyrophosphatase (non-canonical NTP hydrolase)